VRAMEPERWRRVEELYHSALSLPEERRADFLESSCKQDKGLRSEVESLLAHQEMSEGFIESPAIQIAAQIMALEQEDAEVDAEPEIAERNISHYRVVEKVGAGGMGEVYRAHDPRLGRDVAIKVLPRIFASDPDRLRRFEQEARAAAALNHPGILAIYDVGTTIDNIPYVVSELLDGETLRECLARGPLPVRKAVELALQMANGLAAAHDKGIIHRDLKPENLFLIKDGRLKILDFGLAKLISAPDSSSDVDTLTNQTGAGVVMGTVGYMPPEQLRSRPVDQRSDIFALGAILYEMLCGKRAFHGDTPADTVNAILSGDPAPLSKLNPSIPPGFERVVRRCLEKNPNERFHSVRDVAFALEALSDIPVSDTMPTRGLPPSSSGPLRLRKRPYAYAGLAAAVAIAVAGVALYYNNKIIPSSSREWQQLTNFPDSAIAPALSPDGHMLTFLRGPDTFMSNGDLYVKMLPHGEPVQLTDDGMLKTNPVFSPDGSRITYTVGPTWDTWTVPVFGGKTQLLLPNAAALTWVDAQHILFSELKTGIHMGIATATESRTEKRDIYLPELEEGMAHRSYLSPDHKWVLVASEMGPSIGFMPCRVVPFNGGSPGKIAGPSPGACTYGAWSPDGRWMFFTASVGRGFHIWRQRFPDGEPEQLTFGPTEEEGLAVAPDGRSLVTSVGQWTGTVWVHDKSGDRQIAFEGSATGFMDAQQASRATFSPDGTKLYFLGRKNPQEPQELWEADLTSGQLTRLFPGISVANSYDVSRDGQRVVLDAIDAHGQPHLWLAWLNHRQPPRQLGFGLPETEPLFGLNDDLFFQAQEEGRTFLWHRPIDGGEGARVMPNPIARFETISPDGRWVVAEAPVSGENVTRGVLAFPVGGGTPKRICYSLCSVRWTQDGKSLYLSLPGRSGKESALNYKTFIVPLHADESFPSLPSGGIKSDKDVEQLRGVKTINELVRPGPDGSRYAIGRSTVHRNIYSVPLP
jgi:eukaryotic-like serine/threonine-protein kinase